MRGNRWVVAGVAVAALVLGGCKPKVGAKCNSGQEICTDKASGLFCGADNKFAAMSCGGPDGCKQSQQGFACDNSLATATDGCETNDDVACAADKKAALECHSNKFEVGSTCKGPKGCTIADDKISCDNDISDEGDACHFDDDYACTTDKQLVLRCKDKKMLAYNACRGPNGCVIKEEPVEHKIEFDCDDSVAQLGDSCDTESEEACTSDKKALLICKSAKFVAHKTCSGAQGCVYEPHGDRYFCDGAGAGTGTIVAHPGSSATAATAAASARAGTASSATAAHPAASAGVHPAASAHH
ncbi:MAG: hypothetical protein ABI421_09300 [Polyangiaceae bacterium]